MKKTQINRVNEGIVVRTGSLPVVTFYTVITVEEGPLKTFLVQMDVMKNNTYSNGEPVAAFAYDPQQQKLPIINACACI